MAAAFDVALAGELIAGECAAAVAFLGDDGATATAMLPILHRLQHAFGYVDPACVPLIADALNVSRAEVHGALTFYHDFRTEPGAPRTIKLCRAEACQANGVEGLVRHLAHAHGVTPGGMTADGRVAIETVYCLGNCSCGPAALVGDDLHGTLDAAGLDRLIAQAREAA